MTEDNLCCKCNQPATWVRRTQFSGSHPFCIEHAKQEEDFEQSDSTYFFCDEVSPDKTSPEYRLVCGYDNYSQLLCRLIHLQHYDMVEAFYSHSVTELRRQAASDQARNRTQLAMLLEEAASAAEEQQKRFARIWKLCKPHMKE